MSHLRFLRLSAYDPFTGLTWQPDGWVAPATGAVAYGPADLPRWIANELWWVELGGDVVRREHSVVAARARLVEPVPGWDRAAAAEFVGWLVERHPGLGYSPDPSAWTPAWEAAYVAAHTAGMDAEEAGGDYRAAEGAEWDLQAGWLAGRLGLA